MPGKRCVLIPLLLGLLCCAVPGQVLEHVRFTQPAKQATHGPSVQHLSHQPLRVRLAPELDGELTDPCWADPAACLGSFRLGLSPTPAQHRREAWAAYDDEHLYFAVKLEREPGSELRAICTDPDSVQLWQDDEFEVFLDPFGSGTTYYQLIVNSAGVLYDAIHTYSVVPDPGGASPTDTKLDRSTDLAWSSGVQIGRAVHPEDWTVELALPLRSIGLAGAPAGHGVRFNLTSADWDTGEYTCLSPVSDWHDPLQFGELRLGEKRVEVESLDVGPVGFGKCSLGARVSDLAGQAADCVLRLTLRAGGAKTTSERGFSLPAHGTETVRLTFETKATSGPWEADVTVSDPSGRPVFAARRGGTVLPPLTVRLGSRAAFADGPPVRVAVSLGFGDVTARHVRLSARLLDGGGRMLAEQDLVSPPGTRVAARLPIRGLSAGTYWLQFLASEGNETLPTACDMLRVGDSPFADR